MDGGNQGHGLEFFVDRSLGGKAVPATLRSSGIMLHTLAEVYGKPADEGIADVDWLALAGQRGWPVLMRDTRIRYRPAERAALTANKVQAFCLTRGNLNSTDMAAAILRLMPEIIRACQGAGPCLYTFGVTGPLRRIDL